jgi:hypothetical protein
MGRIRFDRTGDLVENVVWCFDVVTDWERWEEQGWLYGEWSGKREHEEIRDCRSDRSHVTATRLKKVTIDLEPGKIVPDFLALTNHGFSIASSEFARKLRVSDLTGYELVDGVEICVNYGAIENPKLYIFDVSGRAGSCRRWKVEDAPNVCPYCNKEPILCSERGWRSFFDCPRCGKRVHHGGGFLVEPDGLSLLLEEEPTKPIVEARAWDGKDLFCVRGHGGGWFANRRAKAWFDRTHVIGVEFEPALLNVEGIKDRLPDGSKLGT